ncbi:MAG: hypothetical protein ABI837_07330, partial [Acidobacteriota bacterium]
MSEEFAGTIDDQSHYEISLTAGQAFLAFVLLLLSLAASFAFGLMIGKGQADERLVVRKEPAIIQEGNVAAGKRSPGRIVDLGVSNDDFKAPATRGAKKESVVDASVPPTPVIAEETAPATDEKATVAAAVNSHPVPAQPSVAPASAPLVSGQVRQPEAPKASSAPAKASPVYAQLLSTGDQKTAEALAAKLIDHGFTGAYVERLPGDRGRGPRTTFATAPGA